MVYSFALVAATGVAAAGVAADVAAVSAAAFLLLLL